MFNYFGSCLRISGFARENHIKINSIKIVKILWKSDDSKYIYREI